MLPRNATVSGTEHRNKSFKKNVEKLDFLARFQDKKEDDFGSNEQEDEDDYDDIPINTMRLSLPVGSSKANSKFSKRSINQLDTNIEEGLQTLTLKDGFPTLRSSMINNNNVNNNNNNNSISNSGNINNISGMNTIGYKLKFLTRTATPTLKPEPEEDFLSGIEDLSPGTFSASSPKLSRRRKSLSNYSENVTETDDTEVSEFADAELEDVDNIFGFEESGVYNSGGGSFGKLQLQSKAKALLQLKQKEMQLKAENEEKELMESLKQNGGIDYFSNINNADPNNKVNTLRLKDFNANTINFDGSLERDALENEKTINYEYTRDDFEDFEDGFDLNTPMKFNLRFVSNKKSMPQFPHEYQKNRTSNSGFIKKHHSLMDVNSKLKEEDHNESDHPFFNNRNNKLIRKLNRIPSFYQKQNNIPEDLSSLDELDEKKEMQLKAMDLEMENKKRELLSKYMELTKTQIQNKRKHKQIPKTSSKKLGLVRYLNEGNGLPSGLINEGNGGMKYNPYKHSWEGNYIDLHKFDSIKSLRTTKPRLITKEDYKVEVSTRKKQNQTEDEKQYGKEEKVVGNMRYDPESMKWINMDVAEEEDIFSSVPDLITIKPKRMKSQALGGLSRSSLSNKQISNLIKNQKSPEKFSKLSRGVSGMSAFTQNTETTSSSTSSDSNNSVIAGEITEMQSELLAEVTLNEKLIEKFLKEEARLIRKTRHWFNENESYDYRRTEQENYNKEYFWEIRKMVTEDENLD